MHAIQTSGNCIRNITTDHFAGVAPDEIVDPLVWCEVLRQWSALNPEFAYLPRKFKIAVNGSREDRAATRVHDVGLHAVRGSGGETGFRVSVGGGLGRTPMIGHVIREFLPWQHLLTYLDAILRVYNRHGRRDNKYRARVKFLVKERGAPEFAHEIDAEWTHLKGGPATLIPEEVERIAARFVRPAYEALPARGAELEARLSTDAGFARWHGRNVHPHKVAGYAAVTVSLKRPGSAPGDVTAAEMDALAVLADRYSHGELRVTHEQNLILADVRQRDLAALWCELRALGLAVPNIGLLTNIVACPGGDFCSLANARSIPVAEAIRERFEDLDYVHDIGPLDLNISGCMNSCGHHHVGHIGILGVDKDGSEWYQISIGGSQGEHASLGKVIGPSFAQDEVADVIERLIACYLAHRDGDAERFVDTVARIGISPFKEYVYGNAHQERSRAPRQLAAA
jgi:sulfite reductase (NADPH) hemoprotein beta-component